MDKESGKQGESITALVTIKSLQSLSVHSVVPYTKNVVGIYLKSQCVLHDNPLPPSSCWLQNAVFFYVTVAAFLFLILLCNICVFIVVLIQIRQMRINKPSANSRGSLHDLRAAAGLTVLLGLTWAVGFFSFGPGRVVFMYLFTIFNTLQGKYDL